MPSPVMDLAQAGAAWDVEEFFAALYLDEEATRGELAVYMDVIRDYDPDVVIDSFGLLTCLATRVLSVPLVTVLQGNILIRPAMASCGGRRTAQQVYPAQPLW